MMVLKLGYFCYLHCGRLLNKSVFIKFHTQWGRLLSNLMFSLLKNKAKMYYLFHMIL